MQSIGQKKEEKNLSEEEEEKDFHSLYILVYVQAALRILVKPTDYVDPYGTLNHLHKIPFHLSPLGPSETL